MSPSPTLIAQPKKLSAVESIRGLACLMVLLSHLSLTYYPKLHNYANELYQDQYLQSFIHHSPFGFFYSGTAAVFIFFVLSGYILTYVAFRGTNVRQRIYSMTLKRYPRLMLPACVSCLLAFYLLSQWRVDTSVLSSWINDYRLSEQASILDAFYTGTVKVFTVTGINPYNPVLWTMKVELVGSIFIFVFAWFRVYFRNSYWCYILDASLLVICAWLFYSNWLVIQFTYGLLGFSIGYLFVFYGRNISNAAGYSSLIVGIYLAGYHDHSTAYQWFFTLFSEQSYFLANFLAGPFIVYGVLFNDKLSASFSNAVTLFLGKVSFAAYLLHMMLLMTVSASLFNAFYQWGVGYDIAALVSIILTVICIYLLSWGFYYGVDKPGMIISQKLAGIFLKK